MQSLVNNSNQFLAGGGEMGALIRGKDWTQTPIGDPEHWPQSLLTTLSIILNSKFPMFLFWGPELTCFYNDAYRPSLGKDGKHPYILGIGGKAAWPEIWDIIKPLIDTVLSGGEANWSEDQLIPIFRNNKIENVYWTFSYSPVMDESGKRAGVFVTCSETTDKVINLRLLEESKNQLQFAIEAAELGTWDLDTNNNKLRANDRFKEWAGIPLTKDIELSLALSTVAEKDREQVVEAIYKALQYSSGGDYDIEYTLTHQVTGKERIIRAKGRAWFNDQRVCYRFNGTAQDITSQALAWRKIKESEERNNTVLMQSPFAFSLMKGKDMVIILANDLMKELWGKGMEVEGKPLLEVLPELKDQPFPEMLDKVYTSGIPVYANEILGRLKQNGEVKNLYFNIVYQPHFEQDEKIAGVIAIAHEVTNQVVARKKIEESEHLYHTLIQEASVAAALYFGAEMRIEIVNDLMISYWGKDKNVIGKPLIIAVPELAGQPYLQYLKNVFTSGKPYTGVEEKADLVINGNLQSFYFNYTYKPLKDKEGKIYGIHHMAVDVTDQVMAKQALQESELRFRNMAETIPEIAWVASPGDGPYHFYNKRFYEYSGMNEEQAGNDWKWESIVHPDMFEKRNKVWEECLKTGKDFYFETLLKRNSDQSYRWHISRATAIRNENGEINLWVGTATDIHDQKLFAQELENQVQERTKELIESNMHLQHSNENLKQFASIASHDLQEPLRKIQTFTALLDQRHKNEIPAPAISLIDKIRISSERMSVLIRDVLNFSKITHSENAFINTDLNEILSSVLYDFELMIREKKVIINKQDLPSLEAIPIQIHQLFYNLVGNAIKFSKNDMQPVVSITSEKLLPEEQAKHTGLNPELSYQIFIFKDNGIGFEQQFGEDIFMIFHRLNNNQEYSGTGIGLALCKRITDNHHGKIFAESKENEGATFYIILPLIQSNKLNS